MLEIVAGFLLGLGSVLAPTFSLPGQCLAFLISPTALVAHYGVTLVYGTFRECWQPHTTGDPILMTIAADSLNIKVRTIIKLKIVLFVIGMTGAASLIQFNMIPALPQSITWIILAIIMFINLSRVNFFENLLVLLLIGLTVKVLSELGYTAAVMAVVSAVGLTAKGLNQNESSEVTFNLLPVGLLSAIVPGLNPGIVCRTFQFHNGYLTSVLASTFAEGYSLMIFLNQRGTSKTMLTSFLGQLSRGHVIDSFLLTLTLLGVIFFTYYTKPLYILIGGWIKGSEANYTASVIPYLTTVFFLLQSPHGVLGGLIAGAVLICGAYFVRIDERIRPLFVSMPILLG